MDYLSPSSPLQELFSNNQHLYRQGLDHVRNAAQVLFTKNNLPPAILVGGTNGKGTTAGSLWRLLSAGGLKVGLFTSPHLQFFHERIQVTGLNLSDEVLITELDALKKNLGQENYEQLTFFEIYTLLALWVFQKNHCDLMVLEVGLGGRLDATNIVTPVLSVITSIDYDHVGILGDTLQKIAVEKLGITRPGVPLIWGGCVLDPSVNAFVEDFGKRSGIEMLRQVHPKILPARITEGAKLHNFELAATAYDFLVQKGFVAAPLEGAVEKFEEQALPSSFRGRLDLRSFTVGGCEHQILFDVSHNPASIDELLKFLKKNDPHKRILGCVSILKDKDHGGMIDQLQESMSEIRLFANSNPRSFHKGEILERHQGLEFYGSFAELWSVHSPADFDITVVCGSFFGVSEALSFLKC